MIIFAIPDTVWFNKEIFLWFECSQKAIICVSSEANTLPFQTSYNLRMYLYRRFYTVLKISCQIRRCIGCRKLLTNLLGFKSPLIHCGAFKRPTLAGYMCTIIKL